MVMMDASVVQINLTTHEMKVSLQTAVYRQASQHKMKLYDRVVLLANYNADSSHLCLIFADATFSGIYNTATGQLYWQLPQVDCGRPLALHQDMDKIVAAYDTNKVVVFDTINRRMHQWTVDNLTKLPKNFLSRYNRIIGVVQLSTHKYILWTNYTYAVLDLQLDLP